MSLHVLSNKHIINYIIIYICSAQSGNLQIALRKLKINRMRANLQIGTQSADCAILIAQTVKPQVLLQQPQIPPLLY